MMATLRVAGAQMPVTTDVAANQAALLRAIDYAAREGAEMLLTPEGSLSGYTHLFDPAAVDAALIRVCEYAAERSVGLALGTCFREGDDRTYNQIRFYLPSGEYLGFHSKTLTCGTLDSPSRGEIEHYAVAPLRTFAWNGITIGGLICNDLWANPACTPGPDPHLTQRLAEMGAKVILHAVNGGRAGNAWSQVAWRYHEANLRMRARAGGLWVVTVDSCHPVHLPCSAPSGVITPSPEIGPGDWVIQAPPQGEQMFAYTLHL